MGRFSLDALKSEFADKPAGNYKQGNSDWFSFNDVPIGGSVQVRFLPDVNEDNPKGFLVEKKVHRIPLTAGGNDEVFTCPGEGCPICVQSRAFYDAKDEKNGKILYRKLSHIGQVLVRDGGEPKVKFITLGYQIYSLLKAGFSDLDESPIDFEKGTDFVIAKQQVGGYSNYNLGTKFLRKESALTSEEIAVVEEQSVDLATLIAKPPSIEYAQGILEQFMEGVA